MSQQFLQLFDDGGGAGHVAGVAGQSQRGVARVDADGEFVANSAQKAVCGAEELRAAMGLLQTDMQYEHARSLITSLTKIDGAAIERINDLVAELAGECRRDLDNDGVPPDRQRFQRFAECRYHGQGFELRANMPDGAVTAQNVNDIRASFHEQHRRDYGYAFEDAEVELITIRVIGSEDVPPLKVARLQKANGLPIDGARLYARATTFDDGQTIETPRFDRDALMAGHRVPGPAIIIQHNSTTLVPPAYAAEVTDYGSLHIRRV